MNDNKIQENTIRNYLADHLVDTFQFQIYDSIDSTNTMAKKLADSEAIEGTVILAEEQVAGRGRQGRSFFSPSKSGIYMSLILRPNVREISPASFTTMAAVAVAEAMEELIEEQVDIKWVNDIYIKERKVCGILTEGAFDMEKGGLKYAVVGIGINVTPPKEEVPEELEQIITTLSQSALQEEHTVIDRNELIAKVLNHLWGYYKKLPQITFYEGYKKRSFLIGRKVGVLSNTGEEAATVLDVNQQFELVVQLENGEIKHLNSGEVRIRWKE